jgi:DNA-binding NtrC family response regulator
VIRRLADIEKQAILEAIVESGGVMRAADALGIGKTTIYRKLTEYGIARVAINLDRIRRELKAVSRRNRQTP